MEPNKFEEHIKKSLREREIKPSPNAWDEIVDQLDAPEKKKGTNYFWYAIAAGFIGILMVSVLYFIDREDAPDGNIQIVDAPDKSVKQKRENTGSFQKEMEKNNTVTATKDTKPVDGKKDTETSLELAIEETVVATVLENGLSNIEKKAIVGSSEKIIDTKIAEVVAQVNLLEQSKEAVTEAEVDSLLRQAQREILTDKLFRENGDVDAVALLSEVEEELDQSFRDQIFEKLKTGFVKVRTAVADRNN